MKEIEHIDPKYYNILNDYIRVGKRTLLQKENILTPLMRRERELYNKLTDNFKNYKTKYFEIRTIEYPYASRKDASIICSIPDTLDLWADVEIKTANTFEDMFKSLITSLISALTESDYYADARKVINDAIEELRELINKIKKDNILIFFEYTKVRERKNQIMKMIQKKDNEQNRRYNTIKTMWNKDNFPQPGMPVKYIAGNYKDQRVGMIVGFSDNYETTLIKTKGNKTIQRDTSNVSWPNKFQDTVLNSYLIQLYGCIPEIWSEKKLDFYS